MYRRWVNIERSKAEISSEKNVEIATQMVIWKKCHQNEYYKKCWPRHTTVNKVDHFDNFLTFLLFLIEQKN